ncbi:MAG: hypothetical protein Q7J09_02650 [Methanocalculus sp.]|uniref:hypothetical protein n=1 Tax=Methanocalculus sp. TaxID=2004547 RepID=UPI0027289160|nr:hypothetical protein [Methanocalculus sp.]MDO9538889.1 hypothetical protein [Methanocalculus sp.]
MKKAGTTPLLDTLDDYRVRMVLSMLIRDDPSVTDRIEEYARSLLDSVDYKNVADSLYSGLNAIEIEDVWDSSGKQRDGSYIDTGERAYEMVEEILEPYTDEISAYLQRGMPDESREYCMGVILGLWRFNMDSCSDLLDELPDSFPDFIEMIKRDWEKEVKDPEQIALLSDWLEEEEIEPF